MASYVFSFGTVEVADGLAPLSEYHRQLIEARWANGANALIEEIMNKILLPAIAPTVQPIPQNILEMMKPTEFKPL